jgi:hypothetical protein
MIKGHNLYGRMSLMAELTIKTSLGSSQRGLYLKLPNPKE